jgi:hypothetical protein
MLILVLNYDLFTTTLELLRTIYCLIPVYQIESTLLFGVAMHGLYELLFRGLAPVGRGFSEIPGTLKDMLRFKDQLKRRNEHNNKLTDKIIKAFADQVLSSNFLTGLSTRVADPDLIGSVDPDSESGSGSRRAKMTHKSRKKFMF